ncbi:MAG: aminotransferase class I/II-fold pyridoxal phosphate-dependent enzyme, partial [Planctomycetes bacterium]|nr:aminotransferase class I/II-fold pyridoxal phosphate-dependent enzyme [Planctomycetota bacterium]
MINLFSDTQTLPTPEMLEAIARAELGDDVLREDPTTNRLEEEAARLFGKEAALLLPSGTMANLVSLIGHGGHGDEVFLDPGAHVYNYECGSLCSLAGYTPRFYRAERGRPDPDSFRAAIRSANVHFPRPRLLWLENTHNLGGGAILRPPLQKEMAAMAREHGLKVHIDGARIFNAAVALKLPAAELARDADSVSFCLSKGLSCPVGSLAVGPARFIDEARRARKRLGGGMRQAGIVAACGLVALKTMVARLEEDHRHARALAEALVRVPGLAVNPGEVETN